MSNTSDGASGNAPVGTASVNADELEQRLASKLEAKLTETFNKMLGARLERQLESTFKKWADESPAEPTEKADGGNTAPSLKSLQSQIGELQKQLADEKAAALAAADKARKVAMRSEIGQELSQLIGGDNPNLPLAMSHWFDVAQRFARDDGGTTYVKFKSQYGGDDDLLPLKDGLKKLVETEGKHLMPSKTAGLPASQPGMRGQVVRQPQGGPNAVNAAINEAVTSMLTRNMGPPK